MTILKDSALLFPILMKDTYVCISCAKLVANRWRETPYMSLQHLVDWSCRRHHLPMSAPKAVYCCEVVQSNGIKSTYQHTYTVAEQKWKMQKDGLHVELFAETFTNTILSLFGLDPWQKMGYHHLLAKLDCSLHIAVRKCWLHTLWCSSTTSRTESWQMCASGLLEVLEVNPYTAKELGILAWKASQHQLGNMHSYQFKALCALYSTAITSLWPSVPVHVTQAWNCHFPYVCHTIENAQLWKYLL